MLHRVSTFFLEENLPFQNRLSDPDRPTSSHNRGCNVCVLGVRCFRFIKIKFVSIGLVIYLLVNDLYSLFGLCYIGKKYTNVSMYV